MSTTRKIRAGDRIGIGIGAQNAGGCRQIHMGIDVTDSANSLIATKAPAGMDAQPAGPAEQDLTLDGLGPAPTRCAHCGEGIQEQDLDNGDGAVWVDGVGAMYCNDDDTGDRHEPES